MKKELMNLFMFLVICFLGYILFRGLNFNLQVKEGMTDGTTSATDGTAGNAATYASTIKAETVKLHDTYLISKYRKDYENIILNLDDYINMMMLKTATTMDINNPGSAITKLSEMNNAKTALNNVMKFVDSSS
jgi:hypothetical protein